VVSPNLTVLDTALAAGLAVGLALKNHKNPMNQGAVNKRSKIGERT
tara:strand:- start:420 stop:557 length:138 start_codon:yes stop_codon:yes gene_type:complete